MVCAKCAADYSTIYLCHSCSPCVSSSFKTKQDRTRQDRTRQDEKPQHNTQHKTTTQDETREDERKHKSKETFDPLFQLWFSCVQGIRSLKRLSCRQFRTSKEEATVASVVKHVFMSLEFENTMPRFKRLRSLVSSSVYHGLWQTLLTILPCPTRACRRPR